MLANIFSFTFCLDAPLPWQINTQDPASPAMEGMITFHEYLMFFLVQIGVAVCWYLWVNRKDLKVFLFTHDSTLEVYWTILPALILLFIAVPSFILLYSLDDVVNPTISVKVVGHQWYWSYEFGDSFSKDGEVYRNSLSFDSYLTTTADLLEGQLRLLEVDRRLVLPINTHIRLLISSSDVLHSWAVPAVGAKIDACPGRVNIVNLFLKRSGVYYGQCSEICGTNHGFMPIVIVAKPEVEFWNIMYRRSLKLSMEKDLAANTPREPQVWYDVNFSDALAPRLIKNKFFAFFSSHVHNYATPSNLSYAWSWGAMAGILLVIMIASGTFLAMHYIPELNQAFNSVELIMVDIEYGWCIRYLHANGASVFFILVYGHMLKAVFYSSYAGKRSTIWYVGLVIFILMMATAFIGYVLPWGQMSLWGATVITNLFGTIPKVGKPFVDWLWGGYSVDGPTLIKFFALHFTLPYIIVACVFVHLAALHSVGSNNPLAVENGLKTAFAPTFVGKDIFFFFFTFFVLGVLVFFYPNALGHPDNYIKANALVTPAHIVPEWYFLPFYAILRSIPDKTGGVVAMAAAILALFSLPSLSFSSVKGAVLNPVYGTLVICWALNVVFLGWIGQLPVEQPYQALGLAATHFYFLFFPLVGFLKYQTR